MSDTGARSIAMAILFGFMIHGYLLRGKPTIVINTPDVATVENGK